MEVAVRNAALVSGLALGIVGCAVNANAQGEVSHEEISLYSLRVHDSTASQGSWSSLALDASCGASNDVTLSTLALGDVVSDGASQRTCSCIGARRSTSECTCRRSDGSTFTRQSICWEKKVLNENSYCGRFCESCFAVCNNNRGGATCRD